MANPISKIDDCDGCAKLDCEVWPMDGMLLCNDCRKKQLEAKAAEARVPVSVENLLQRSRQQDQSITVKADLFNAHTVAFVELRAAIQADANIPEDKKNYTFMKAVEERVVHFQNVILEQEKELLAKRNEKHAWVTQAQAYMVKLREDERTQFRQFDINYTPTTVAPTKSRVKAAASVGGKKTTGKAAKFDPKALKDAATKYGVPAVTLQSVMQSHKEMTYEGAAQYLKNLLNPSAEQAAQ